MKITTPSIAPVGKPKGWIGVDLDGTLAVYDGYQGLNHIGEPVPRMVALVKQWILEGKDVRIMTARVARSQYRPDEEDVELTRSVIKLWCAAHLGAELEVTNQKDYAMIELWDDRAVQVIPNTGITLQHKITALESTIKELRLQRTELRDEVERLREQIV